ALALFDLATSDAPAADLPGDLYNSLLAAASDSLAIARKVFDRMLERGVAFKDVGFGCFIGKLCRSEEDETATILKQKRSWGWRQRENEYKEFILSLVSESRIHEAKDIGEAIVLGDFQSRLMCLMH
ncbi:hypothetical protein ACMD2_24873, partial [Ananas comosus]